MSRKGGRRGLASIEASILGKKNYIKRSKKRISSKANWCGSNVSIERKLIKTWK